MSVVIESSSPAEGELNACRFSGWNPFKMAFVNICIISRPYVMLNSSQDM